MLSVVVWNIKEDTVKGFWNSFENKLINNVDIIIPMNLESNNINNIESGKNRGISEHRFTT